MKDKVKYSYLFTDTGNKLLKDSEKIWKTDNKKFTFNVEIAKFWPDMSCRDQDQLLSSVEVVGYDQIKLFKFKYKNSTDYLYYSTFERIGFQQTIMLFCDLLPKLINSKISK